MTNVVADAFLGPAGFATPHDNEMLNLAQRGIKASPAQWSDISRGMNPADWPLTASGSWDEENRMRAYWARWDRMMGDVDTLEAR